MPIYIKFDGVDGDVTAEEFKNSIEVLSFSWGMTNEGGRPAGGGGGAGRVNVQDFNFTKHTDKSSPVLMLACAKGTHIKKAVLFVRKTSGDTGNYLTAAGEAQSAAGEEPEAPLKIRLYDVLVSGFVIKGEQKADDDWPTESLSLNFSKVEFIERSQDPTGGLGIEVPAIFDIKTNKFG